MPKGVGTVFEMRSKDRYGNYYKRQKPWAWRLNGKYMGFYETREEAELAARLYHKNHKESDEITFSQMWELWLKYDSDQIIDKTVQEYRRKYQCYCKPLYDRPYSELRPKDFIDIMEKGNLSNGTKNNILKFFRALDRCAYKLEIVDRKATEAIPYYKKIETTKRNPFSEEEIKKLWNNLDVPDVDLVLILLYTGFRSGELAKLKLKDINLEENFMIGGSKTKAGKDRQVPIHPRIKPLIENRMTQAKKDTLLNYTAKTLREHFKAALKTLKMNHIPHECRHTFVTRLDNAGANRVCVNKIVGHAGNGVGETFYTHKELKQLYETICLLT